jgi:predicted lipoprotein with Yx(FWY)xxD motif
VIQLSEDFRLGILFLSLTVISISALSMPALSLPPLAMSSPADSSDSYTVNIYENKFIGSYLVNQTGFTLYFYSNDAKGGGTSTCNDGCAEVWLPFYAPSLSLPETLRSVDFGTITRADGSKQTTFKGWPLYLYSRDTASRDTWGSEKDGLWHVVDPMGQPQLM